MNDSWTERVALPGVVLIGDAAGWNDPIIGEGLSIGLRDACTVADVVASGSDWAPGAFDGYATERRERMRRLCIVPGSRPRSAATSHPRGGPGGARSCSRSARTPCCWRPRCWRPRCWRRFAGPDVASAEAFDEANIDRILALA